MTPIESSLQGVPVRLRGFASDNYAGICPEVWSVMAEANTGHACSYGNDEWTSRAADALRDLFETSCEVFFVFNGTAANSLAIAHLCHSYHSVICSSYAHIETDECGAPEFFTGGTKILHGHTTDGKLDATEIEHLVAARSDIHYPKPRVISLTQATECGTVYSIDELRAVQEVAMCHGLRVHMDGARFANAVAALGVTPKEITWKVGVDVLCLGCTKNGAPVGDAVIFFDRNVAAEFDYRCKQAGQLASKMRFLAAPMIGLLTDGAWLKHAAHANAMAVCLSQALGTIPDITLAFPTQANAVFVHMPPRLAAYLQRKGWHLYDFIGSAYRCMCAWDTTREDIEAFVADVLDGMESEIGKEA
ncbi:MAG: threonine aldolase family protein [Armatimonadota bacterium]